MAVVVSGYISISLKLSRCRNGHSCAHPAADTRAAAPDEPDDDLWGLVRELPDKQRTALALRYVTDAGYDEISAVMSTSEEAARRNVHEALKRLRMEYQR